MRDAKIDEVAEKSWRLLEEHMTPTQYFAFMKGDKVELESNDDGFRLLIDKRGSLIILEGKRGGGIVASFGSVRGHHLVKKDNYSVGDEIAVFIDWFKFKPKELIGQWNCGIYGIVKEEQRR